jgi:hypothetical protein
MKHAWALVLVLLAGCPEETSSSDGTPGDAPIARPDRSTADGPKPGRDQSSELCAAFAREGTSCASGQACPAGLEPANLGGKPCTCHVPCDPSQGPRCKPEVCDRLCVQLNDPMGTPLPNKGACVLDPGAEEGEPCYPQCKFELVCVAHAPTAAFCRRTCQGQGDCVGYKMVCVPVDSQQVCVPGGATAGPKEGESCAEPNAFCVQDLICDPAAKVCRLACDPNLPNPCPAPKTCQKLVDTAANVTVGYGCS